MPSLVQCNAGPCPAKEDMVLVKTSMGQQALKDRHGGLTPRQRSAFILFDGKRSTEEVLAATAAMGITREDVQVMLDQGLLAPAQGGAAPGAPAAAPQAVPQVAPQVLPRGTLEPVPQAAPESGPPEIDPAGPQGGAGGASLDSELPVAARAEGSGRSLKERYRDAYPIAIEITASLGLRGFRLNLAVEGASGFEELAALAPKIREAVGDAMYARLEKALFA